MQQRRLYHLLDLSDSRPSSWLSLSGEVPSIAPVIARAALFYFTAKRLILRLVVDDLSKIVNCIDQQFLIEKLNVYIVHTNFYIS